MWRPVALALILSGLLQTLLVIAVAPARRHATIYVAILGLSLATAPVAWLTGAWLFQPALAPEGRVFLVLIHLTLGVLLFHLMTLLDRSVTLRVLVELLRAHQTLSLPELASRYGLRHMIESRVDQLRAAGFLEVDPAGEVRLRSRGIFLARFVSGGRALFGVGSAN